MMDPGELLMGAFELGVPFAVDGSALVIPVDLPRPMKSEAVRLRGILSTLLSFPVAELCHDMTDDERAAFEERAAILEYDAGVPRDLAERVAVWWTRTPEAERRAA